MFLVLHFSSFLCSTPSIQVAKSEADLNPEYVKEELQSIWNYSCEWCQVINQQANPFLIIWRWCFICKRVMYHKKEKRRDYFRRWAKLNQFLLKHSCMTLIILISSYPVVPTFYLTSLASGQQCLQLLSVVMFS